MVGKDNQHVEGFLKALKDWTDERFVSREEIQNLAMFSVYLVNLFESEGIVYYGHTFKVGVPHCTLVVKADVEGVPSVVFSSGRTYTGCVRAFLRKREEGWLEWQKDRYRG